MRGIGSVRVIRLHMRSGARASAICEGRREGVKGGWGRTDELPDDEIANDSGAGAVLQDAHGDRVDGRYKGRIERRPCACPRGRRDAADVATAEVANGACKVHKAVRLNGHPRQK